MEHCTKNNWSEACDDCSRRAANVARKDVLLPEVYCWVEEQKEVLSESDHDLLELSTACLEARNELVDSILDNCRHI
ncbi:MAG: hypothetical protein ACYS30_22850 [Planctomycetota bacterium]|jgi:hypothetical protein